MVRCANASGHALVRLVGIAELAGAPGVIVPSVTRIRPALVPLAAAGLALTMVPATVIQVSLGLSPMPAPVAFALAAFDACCRWRKAPIPPRSAL